MPVSYASRPMSGRESRALQNEVVVAVVVVAAAAAAAVVVVVVVPGPRCCCYQNTRTKKTRIPDLVSGSGVQGQGRAIYERTRKKISSQSCPNVGNNSVD